jgi:cytochrome c oxidase subunit III
MKQRGTIDVSSLPTHAYEHRSQLWWGNVVMIMIEGTVLAISVATYFYLRENFTQWPPPPTDLPRLLPGTINTIATIAATIPMVIAHRRTVGDRPKSEVVPMLWIYLALALVANIARIYEFPALDCKWNEHAYGSVTWTLLGMHWLHLFASWVETLVMAVYLLSHPLDGKRRVDLNADMIYWYFVVATEVLVYIVIYWTPRWM